MVQKSPTNLPSNIVRIPFEHANFVSEILSLAFEADPLIKFLIPNEKDRISHGYKFFLVLVRNGLRKGEVYGILPDNPVKKSDENPYAAISVWFHDQNSFQVSDLIRSGVIGYFKYRFFYRMIPIMGALQNIDKIHQEHVPFEHYYLSLLGAHPDYRGKKYTATLLRVLFKEFEAMNLPTYVETMNEQNLPMYQHLGYKVIGKVDLDKAGIHIWSMLRPIEKQN